MYNIIRYIRQNKVKLIGVIIFIIFVYSMILTANKAYENQEKQKTESSNLTTIKTDGTITLTEKKCKQVIDEFVKYCTKGDYERAYSYLAQECKEKKYSSLEDFKNNYCIANSLKGKGYEVEKYKSYTYKIEYNNTLSTGGMDSKKTIMYYSITVENGHDIRINID